LSKRQNKQTVAAVFIVFIVLPVVMAMAGQTQVSLDMRAETERRAAVLESKYDPVD